MNPKLKLTLLILAVIAALAGAAYLAMIYIFPNFNLVRGRSGGHFIHQIRAPEVPAQKADLTGLVANVVDNSIFVAQMNSVTVSSINGGQKLLQPTPQGPYSEVLISKNTKIWLDVTNNDPPGPGSDSSGSYQEIQQKVESADITAITSGSNIYVEVWGQKRGDRLDADVIVVHNS